MVNEIKTEGSDDEGEFEWSDDNVGKILSTLKKFLGHVLTQPQRRQEASGEGS